MPVLSWKQHLMIALAVALCALDSPSANAQSTVRREQLEQQVVFVAVDRAIRPHVVMPEFRGAPIIVYLPDDSLSVGVVARMLTVAAYSTGPGAPAVTRSGQTLLRSKSIGLPSAKGRSSAARIVRRLIEANFEQYAGYERARRTTVTLAVAPSGLPSRVFKP